MVDCANEFPAGDDRDRYSQAASLVRLPYWDWAVKPESGGVLPDIVQQPSVQVSTPNGTQTIENPLFSYKFEDGSMEELSFDPVGRFTSTTLSPLHGKWVEKLLIFFFCFFFSYSFNSSAPGMKPNATQPIRSPLLPVKTISSDHSSKSSKKISRIESTIY